MKFQFRPNTTIVDYDRMVKICTFDENGFFETDNEKIIKYLTKKARNVKIVNEKTKGKTKKPEDKLPADGFYNCKKCDFKTDNKGKMMAHYREFHPKK